MALSLTVSELSTHNASEYNFRYSPLIRLPPEIRAMIWNFCLSNIHVLIRGRIGDRRSNSFDVVVQRLDEQLGFILDFLTHRAGSPSVRHVVVPNGDTVRFKPVAAYDLILSSPRAPNAKPNPACRLPQLWRVCKVLYNETYNLPFAARNIFHFRDWTTLMLLHKYGPRSSERIKSLSLLRENDEGFTKLLQLQVNIVASTDEQIQQRRINLRRVFPALVEIRIENRIAIWQRAAKTITPRAFRREQDRISQCISFWKPLVAKVMMEEAPDIVRNALYGPRVES